MMQEASIAGTRVGYTITPERPLVLLTRMAGRGMGVWNGVWAELAKDFSIANFDLSPARPEQLERCDLVFADYARIAAEVASALGHERFGVIGWNGGTHVALRCALDFPDRVFAAVLLSPFFELSDMRSVWKGLEIMQAMMATGDRELYAFYWFMSGLSDPFVAANFDRISVWAKARAGHDPFVQSELPRMAAWARAIRRNWLTDADFSRITVPMLLAAPTLDKWSAGPTLEMAVEMARRLPRARLQELNGLGSLVLYEDPRRFLDAAVPFLLENLSAARVRS